MSAIEHFLGRLRRNLSAGGRPGSAVATEGGPAVSYRVVSINEPFVNEKIGTCLVLSRVGQGAMSVVYKAKQDVTDRIVAIKILRSQLAYDPNNVKRFEREARAMSRLKHPNLISVYEVGSLPSGQPYIVMDFVEGSSLGDLIAQRGPMPWQIAAPLFMQACDAMAHAHRHNIIHRDLKPDNIMLLTDAAGVKSVKVVDFGIVKLTDESQRTSQRLTATGEVWGSPVYMSPEQCMGKPLDFRCDIYALGLVFYECLTGVQVIQGKKLADLIMKQISQKPQPFKEANPSVEVPPWVEAIVMKALEKEPLNRFQSMMDMKREFEIHLESRKDTAEVVQKPGFTPAPNSAGQTQLPPVPMEQADLQEDEFLNKLIDDKYLVQAKLGEGGMSVVYRALQQGMNRHVAIKVMRDELVDDAAYKKRFQREAKALSSLNHPNLVSIYDVGTAHTGQSYIVMEYLDGAALSDVLDDKGFLAAKRAVPVFIQVCDVMNYLHQQGVIHRDLKPHNVMLVDRTGHRDFVKIVDFGILKFDDSKHVVSQRLTASGDICGSPIYMSPEQILDEKLDGRTDIYAWGIAMYETLMGTPPFTGRKVAELLNQHINVPPKPFAEARPDLKVPTSLEMIVMRALEKERENRYQTMGDMKEDLMVLHARLEQELTALVNGEPIPNLPPLPVAGKMAATGGNRATSDSVSKGNNNMSRQSAASSRGQMPAIQNVQPGKGAPAVRTIAITAAVLIGLLLIGLTIVFVVPHFVTKTVPERPAANDDSKPEKPGVPEATKPSVPPVNTQDDDERPPLPSLTGPTKDNTSSSVNAVPRTYTSKKNKARVRTNPNERLSEELESIDQAHRKGNRYPYPTDPYNGAPVGEQ